jgi:hypothetical protein
MKMRDFDDFDKSFDRAERTVTRFLWIVALVVIVALAVGTWAVIELVGWIKTK